jgi:hypothetical protein
MATTTEFGPTAAYFPGDNLSGLSLPASTDWDFGSGDFTIDAWVYYSGFAGGYGDAIAGDTAGDNSSGWAFGILGSSYPLPGQLSFASMSGAWATASSTVPLNQWTHVAAIGHNGTIQLYINGQASGAAVSYSSISSSGLPLVLHDFYPGNAHPGYWNANPLYIDEFHLLKGIALWTSNFTPPAQEYFK